MKKQQPKPKLDSLMSEQKRLLSERKFSKNYMSDKAISKFTPFSRTLSKMARISDSVKVVNNSKLIRKELVNIKPPKPVVAKVKSDNTKIASVRPKKIAKK